MARIQILELPSKVTGDYVETPFALVIDQVETERVVGTIEGQPLTTAAELTQHEANAAAQAVGAVGAILAACTLDVV